MPTDTMRSKANPDGDYIVSDTNLHTHIKHDTDRSEVPFNQSPANLGQIPKPNPLVGLLTISALMLPITIIPFLSLRRRLVRMEKVLDKMACAYEASIRDEIPRVRTVQDSHQRWLQSLDKQLVTLAVENKSNIKGFGRDLSGLASRLNENDERYKHYVADRQALRKSTEEIGDIIKRHERQVEALTLSATRYDRISGRLGNSLADVAAFIHETEVRHGIVHEPSAGSSRRVEILRALGYDLHALSKDTNWYKAKLPDRPTGSDTPK